MDSLTAKMISTAHQALSHAYAPYSKYTVACCLCTDNGNLYSGVNVENSSYGLTFCAEGSAICSMVTGGERLIKNMVVLAGNNLLCSPCGACRQRIYEFSSPQTLVHLCNKDTILRSMTIDVLLPMAFDFNPS